MEEAIQCLTQHQTELSANHDGLNAKMDMILQQLATLGTKSEPSYETIHTQDKTGPLTSHMKLEVPRFNGQGQDAMSWIFKISQFFYYHATPEADRIKVASFYMEGPALSWYQWIYHNGMIVTCQVLLQALETHFAPSYYDDPQGALFKLTQKGTSDYLNKFERLAAESGSQASQPHSMIQTAALARLQDKLMEQKHQRKAKQSLFVPTSAPPLLPIPTKTNYKKLTHEEMLVHRVR